MIFRILEGKNYKYFCHIEEVNTKEDFELYEGIKKHVLYRKEFMPFIKAFNKNIEYSYLIEDFWFPLQFLNDVLKYIKDLTGKSIQIENYDLISNELDREEFDEWLNSFRVPEEIKIDDEAYKYQQDAAFLGANFRMGHIEVSTSGGKTFITYLYCKYLFEKLIENKDRKILVVVPRKSLCTQFIKDFTEYQKYIEPEKRLVIETIYSGSKRNAKANIVCGTYQSLSEYEKEYFDDFSAFVCDEVHGAKAYSIRNEIYSKMYFCEYILGMTGTMPEYKTLDYLHIVSMFGPRLVLVEAIDLIEAGVATPVKVNMIKIRYEEENDFSYNLKQNGIIGKEKYEIEKEFFHLNEKRTELISKLMKKLTENSLIIVDTVEYCTILKNYLEERLPEWTFEIIHGKITGKVNGVDKRDIIFDEMRSAESHYCIIGTYGTMSTGISIKNLTNGYLVDGGKKDTRIGQTIGRLMRLFPNKNVARLFDFYDDIPGCAFKNQALVRIRYYLKKKFPLIYTNVNI